MEVWAYGIGLYLAGVVSGALLLLGWSVLMASREALGPEPVCRPGTKCSGFWTAPHTLIHSDACPLTGVHPDDESAALRRERDLVEEAEARLLTLIEAKEERESA
jgi:hypothetical protein